MSAVSGFRAISTFLEMIKFEHSIFALPFAMIGMMWGSLAATGSAWPGWAKFGWILLAMVSCRSAAMAYNRIADRDIDALNPRTKMRAIPAGLLRLGTANLLFFISLGLFFGSAAMLGYWPLVLSPVAAFVTLIYSRTKRFTPLCHLVLGLGLAIAPGAAYLAVAGFVRPEIVALMVAVIGWTAGFDIIYALQDEEFDREHGLRSIPETLGKVGAMRVSRALHTVAIVALLGATWLADGGLWGWVGVGFVASVLAFEQSLVKPYDLSRVNLAFFTLNGFVSLGFFGFCLLDILL